MTYMPEVTRCRQSAGPVDDFEPSVYLEAREQVSPGPSVAEGVL